MDSVRLAILRMLARDDPHRAREVELIPREPTHLVTALTCERKHLDDAAEWMPHLTRYSYHSPELVIIEDAMACPFSRGRVHAGTGRDCQDAPADAPIEELAYGRQNAIGHNG